MRRIAATLLLACLTAAPVLASPTQAVAAALADSRTLPKEVACRTRYLWLGAVPPAQLSAYRTKLLKWRANGLSTETEFGTPRLVNPELVAVVLDDYGPQWAVVWERQFVEPFFHEWEWKWYEATGGYAAGWYRQFKHARWLDPAAICELEKRTGSRVPIVAADWWFAYSGRQIDLNNKEIRFGYSDWLGVKNLADFEALRFVDRKKAIKIGDELRAALEAGRSGVATLDRQIEWVSAYGDSEIGLWLTHDTDDASHGNTATGNLEADTFRAKAIESIIGLPNRLLGYGLFKEDAKLKNPRQATAPDFVGPNDSALRVGRDGRIHPFTCAHCHLENGFRPVDDWARRTLRLPLQLTDHKLDSFLRLKRQYTRSLDDQLERSRRRYAEALRECVGATHAEIAKLDAAAYYAYVGAHDRAAVARRLGVTEDCLADGLRRYFDSKRTDNEKGRRRLAGLLSLIAHEPQGIPATLLEDAYADLQRIVCEYGK